MSREGEEQARQRDTGEDTHEETKVGRDIEGDRLEDRDGDQEWARNREGDRGKNTAQETAWEKLRGKIQGEKSDLRDSGCPERGKNKRDKEIQGKIHTKKQSLEET
jgi:hypothetical protein